MTNRPLAGGTLDILDEGAGDAPAQLIAPDGTTENVTLKNGQAQVRVELPGDWMVRVGEEQARVRVLAPDGPAGAVQNNSTAPPLLLVLISMALLVLLAMAGAGAWSAAFPPAPSQNATLSARRRGEGVQWALRAGSLPLTQVRMRFISGQVGEKPLEMKARRLEAGDSLRMESAVEGNGGVQAEFLEKGEPRHLQCAIGEEVALGRTEEILAPTKPQTGSVPRRKLARARGERPGFGHPINGGPKG